MTWPVLYRFVLIILTRNVNVTLFVLVDNGFLGFLKLTDFSLWNFFLLVDSMVSYIFSLFKFPPQSVSLITEALDKNYIL